MRSTDEKELQELGLRSWLRQPRLRGTEMDGAGGADFLPYSPQGDDDDDGGGGGDDDDDDYGVR